MYRFIQTSVFLENTKKSLTANCFTVFFSESCSRSPSEWMLIVVFEQYLVAVDDHCYPVGHFANPIVHSRVSISAPHAPRHGTDKTECSVGFFGGERTTTVTLERKKSIVLWNLLEWQMVYVSVYLKPGIIVFFLYRRNVRHGVNFAKDQPLTLRYSGVL